MVSYFLLIKKGSYKVKIIPNSLLNWTIDSAQHQDKWNDELDINEHVESKIPAKIRIYILTRAELQGKPDFFDLMQP